MPVENALKIDIIRLKRRHLGNRVSGSMRSLILGPDVWVPDLLELILP